MFLAAQTLTSKLHQCESYLIRYFFWNRAGSGKTPQDPVGPMPFAMQTEYELEEHHEGYWEFRRKHFQNHQMSLGRNRPSSLFVTIIRVFSGSWEVSWVHFPSQLPTEVSRVVGRCQLGSGGLKWTEFVVQLSTEVSRVVGRRPKLISLIWTKFAFELSARDERHKSRGVNIFFGSSPACSTLARYL